MATKDNSLMISSDILIKPRMTEKASLLSGGHRNVYTFRVAKRANKLQIKKAVHELYKVEPAEVKIINVSRKAVSGRGRAGFKRGFKKAMVYLKKGDKIEFT